MKWVKTKPKELIMGINTGFMSNGFVDDKEEQDRWDRIDRKLSGKSVPQSDETEIDDTYELDDDNEAKSSTEMKEMQMSEVKKGKRRGKSFWGRNKRQILDAALVLGVIYVGYKLFWEKGDGDMEFEGGGLAPASPVPTTNDVAPAPYKYSAPIPQASPNPPIPEVPPMSPVSTP